MFAKRTGLVLLPILLVISLLLPGCSGGNGAEGALFQGWVSVGEPVAGASLTVYNIKGKRIYQTKEPATGDLGSFLTTVKNLPPDFKVVASGGSFQGEMFPAVLSADYRNFQPQSDIIYVNAVTTMVSTYLERNPGIPLSQATLAVKNFLEIPQGVEIGPQLRGRETYFSHQIFIAEAAAGGGVSEYVDQLITEMEGKVTHPFIGHALPGGGNGLLGGMGPGVGGYVVDKLAGGAIAWAGGKALGWGLGKIGLDFPDETGEKLAQMQAQLDEISRQLDNLKSQLDEIYGKLSAEIKQTEYNVRIGQMNDLISSINSIRGQLMIFVSNPPSDPETLETRRAAISRLIETDLLTQTDVIHSQLVGLNGQTPLLKMWVEIVASQHRFLSADDYPRIQGQFDYFATLQQWMLELVVEYYHAAGGETEDYHPNIDSVVDTYNDHIRQQTELLVQKIPDGVFVDTETGYMWPREPLFNISGAEYKTEGGPLQYVYGELRNQDQLLSPDPASALNQNSAVNHGFDDWILPGLVALHELLKGYPDPRNQATEAWFVKNGAFPAGSTLESVWGDSGGNVWTGEYYWAKWLGREVVNLECTGVGGIQTPVAILQEGSAQIGSLLPYRIPGPDERYYW